jgi:phosphoribosyl-AMP cyclohydrolase
MIRFAILEFHAEGHRRTGLRASPSPACRAATGRSVIRKFRIERGARRETGGLLDFWRKMTNTELDFKKMDGLITAVIQDHVTGEVLMVGYMNEEAYARTVETGWATFYSRSRKKLWLKGESSGHRLVVKEIRKDCDADALLVKVEALGPGVCHEGYRSCFFRALENGEWKIRGEKTYDPATVYGEKA